MKAKVALALLALAILGIFVHNYFIRPIFLEVEKLEVNDLEAADLKMLTEAYLNQNETLVLDQVFRNMASANRFAVAAEYLYLKNGSQALNDYEEILSVAQRIFDTKHLSYSNFEVVLDDCGLEVYSSLEGSVSKDSCKDEGLVYEIGDIYQMKDTYYVEFWASKVTLTEIPNKCEALTNSSYNLTLMNLTDEIYFTKDYLRCQESKIIPSLLEVKNEVLGQIKLNRLVYKMTYKKNNDNFIFAEVKK